MYVITYEAKPNEKQKDVAGAFVNCWINFKDYEASCELAKWYIKTNSWKVKRFFEASELKKKECEPEDIKYYKEAKKYSYCIVYHTYPPKSKKNKKKTKIESR